jgi:peptidoglycan/LPS O-acetylase OafA/YrhL
MIKEQKTYFPDLDSLRTLAFLAVFVNHATFSIGYKSSNVFARVFSHKYLSNGDLGVSFFFVLSGFLITWLLMEEKLDKGKISIKNFYMRRVVRIWPVYFLVVILCLLVVPSLQQYISGPFPMRIGIDKLNPYLYLTFLGNYDFIFNGITNSLIAVLWSVSIEEQFYLVWPLIIAFVPTRFLVPSFIIIIIAALSYRLFYSEGIATLIKHHTLSCSADLTVGALAAAMCRKDSFRKKVQELPRYVLLLVYALGITLFCFRFSLSLNKEYELQIHSLMPFAFALFFAFVIVEQNFAARSFFKAGKIKILRRGGKYSYSMYCYHMLVFFLVLFFIQLSGFRVMGFNKYEYGITVICALVITIMLSMISFRYFETPFLRLKRRFQ